MRAARWTTPSLRLRSVVTGTSQLPALFEPNPTLLRPPLPSQCPTESRRIFCPTLYEDVVHHQRIDKRLEECETYVKVQSGAVCPYLERILQSWRMRVPLLFHFLHSHWICPRRGHSLDENSRLYS